MNTFIQPLIELQDIDRDIRELEAEARDIPQRIAQAKARVAGTEATCKIAKDRLAARQQQIKESEAEAESMREKVRGLKTGQLSAKSNKEFQQTTIQIDGLEHEIDVAENRALSMADELAGLEKGVKDAEAKLNAEQGGVSGEVATLTERLEKVTAELNRLESERKEKSAKVQPNHLLYYERLRTKRWPVVVTLDESAEGGVCDGCHLVQPPSVSQMVQQNKNLVACTMCGRILYREF